ncbi:MAG: tetratricopeptide repeat protein [Salinibacter sp.]
MTSTAQIPMHTRTIRWTCASLVLALLVGIGAGPVLAQNGGGSSTAKQKLKQLKQSFRSGMKAAKTDNASQAYSQLEQALQLAQETDQSGAANRISSVLPKLSKNWGNTAIENKNWGDALTHFKKGIKYAENDAYMYYGKGLALVNMDSTETGLKTLQRAVEIGNKTGNTRVSNLATQRIRDEFLARASKALNAQNPTSAQVQTAINALDEMRQYVDPNAQSLFYRARALFEQEQYQQAASTAQEGLSMHQGSRSDAAKYHFIIAESQMNLGNKQSACQTFKQAAYGDYQARAQHYLKNDCQD